MCFLIVLFSMEFLRSTRVLHGRSVLWSHIITRAISDNIQNKNDGVIPVVIVGAGTVGLVLSLLLRKLGIKCVVLEKNLKFSNHPRAHFINIRSMEIFRKLDGLAQEIQASQPPMDLWRKFIYCTSLTGSIIGSVDHIYPQDFDQSVSPSSVAHFSEHKLTTLLLKRLKNPDLDHGYDEECTKEEDSTPRTEILLGHECVHVETRDCVNVIVRDLKNEKNVDRKFRCQFLVAADGAGSTVRKIIGINMFGERNMQELLSIHFFSRDVGWYLLTRRPGMLFFVFNDDIIGVLIAHDLEQGEFILQVPFYPPQQKIEDFNYERCKKLISKLAGCEVFDLNVVDVKPWVMHAEVAERFMSPDNRIILVGDAAHRFPPAGGFGMNTGIQDAHNIAWKLAAVLKGVASPSLLRTYETERRPIAVFNTKLSVKNFNAAMEVPTALGLNPAIANSVHRALKEGIGSVLPATLQKQILEGIFSLGRSQLSDSFLNETNIIGSFRLAKVRRIFDEGRSLQLQFPAEDLGFRYLEGAVVMENDNIMSEREREREHRGGRRDYIPSADLGARLPHMNLKFLGDTQNKGTFSTLDIVRGERVEFVVVIAPSDESYRLARMMAEVAADGFRIPVRICVVWPHGSEGTKEREEGILNVVEVEGPAGWSWWDICGISNKRAILVRPDHHIAWISNFSLPSGYAGRHHFHHIFTTLLGLG